MSASTDTSPAPRLLEPLLPVAPAERRLLRRDVIRVLVAATALLGTYYITWRWVASVNWAAWYIAVPLIVSETYSYLDSLLFGATMWRIRERPQAPPAREDATVDVFITTYNEPVELVREVAIAAREIDWPHLNTYILDDGSNEEMEAMAAEVGIGYITRSADWKDRPRHAKAGNLNNALFQTTGEFLLILDADQVPDPAIVRHALGWFDDPKVALVQTPQWFKNVPDADPLGSQAPLFYGPIQQGKDGWNAAFFCGSNAFLRRDAMMQLGVVGYVRNVETAVRRVVRTADRVLRRARAAARRRGDTSADEALGLLDHALARVRAGLDSDLTLQEITHEFRREVAEISRTMVRRDLGEIEADVTALGAIEPDAETGDIVIDESALEALAARELSPLGAIDSVRALIEELDAVEAHEAQPVMPMATISVTEDMATAMRLHALGWKSVYHHEILAHGLAPEDLGTMLQQRLRWAQGTLQVMLRENPFAVPGLQLGQRFMYFATMWSYLSGFAALAYIAAPILYMTTGVLPVRSFGPDFLWHLVPYLVVNQLLFVVVGYGVRTWRGQQYSLALFPLWIKACTSTLGNVLLKRPLGFVVTPKTRQEGDVSFRPVRWQIVAMVLLALAGVVGLVRLMTGMTHAGGPVMINVVWIVYDLIALSVVIDAALYAGFEPQER